MTTGYFLLFSSSSIRPLIYYMCLYRLMWFSVGWLSVSDIYSRVIRIKRICCCHGHSYDVNLESCFASLLNDDTRFEKKIVCFKKMKKDMQFEKKLKLSYVWLKSYVVYLFMSLAIMHFLRYGRQCSWLRDCNPRRAWNTLSSVLSKSLNQTL